LVVWFFFARRSCSLAWAACLAAGLGSLLVAGLSCSSAPAAAKPDAAPPSPDATADGADADATPSCAQGCPSSGFPNTICVASVQAELVNASGGPVAGQDLLVCGYNLCSLPGKTDAQGSAHFFLCQAMATPALKFLGGASYVSFAAAITQTDTAFAPITLVPLPATGPAFPPAGGTVTSGSATLSVAAGAVTFDPTQPSDPSLQVFLAAPVDVAKIPVPLPASLGITEVWGLAPVNATLTPPATLTIPNTPAWPAGSKVDFYMNGAESEAMTPVPYGGWGAVGTGTVSQDGATITTDTGSGNGIPVLSMVGVRLHT
jgi:hypothetical protein